MAPLTDNPNAPGPDGWTPIQRAASELDRRATWYYGTIFLSPFLAQTYVEMIKILAPLSENPNAKDPKGLTPTRRLSSTGDHSELIKLLKSSNSSPRGFLAYIRNILNF